MNRNEGLIKLPQEIKNEIVVFGTGEVAEYLIKEIEEIYSRDKISYFIDSSSVKRIFKGKKVYHLEEISDKLIENKTFIIASYTKSIIMKKLLMNIGVNERNIIAAKNYFDYKSLQYGSKKINRILIYPPITSNESLDKILENIEWFLLNPLQDTPEIFILVEKNIEYNNVKKRKNVIVCRENDIVSKSVDLVLVFNSANILDLEVREGTEIFCFDKNAIERIDVHMWLALSYRLLKEEIKIKYRQLAKQNFTDLKKIGQSKKAAALGTGPSLEIGLDKLEKIGLHNFIKIVCNRTATSKEIINRIKPEVYTFLSTFTVEKENYESLKIVIDYIENNNCMLIVPNYFLSTLLKFSDTENIILVNVDSSKICFPEENDITVCREVGGVMAGMVLPFASVFCREVYILGCDGKKIEPNEKGLVKAFEEHSKFDYNWSGTLAYEDLDSIVLSMEQHKDILEYGEKRGNIYKSITHSHNQHLENRYYSI